LRLGASIGVSVFPDDGSNTDKLLTAADARMFEQKRARKAGQSIPMCPICKDGATPCVAAVAHYTS
jgi:GGDEF domain-containing protein